MPRQTLVGDNDEEVPREPSPDAWNEDPMAFNLKVPDQRSLTPLKARTGFQ
jgi:hypothetical protein